jgi:hypothetical protein
MSSSDAWRELLDPWQREILGVLGELEPYGSRVEYLKLAGLEAEAWRLKSLSYPPASLNEIGAAETRLHVSLPPSYKTFLSITNGWRQLGMDAEPAKVFATTEIQWLKDYCPLWIETHGNDEPFDEQEYLRYGPTQRDWPAPARYLKASLAISRNVDCAIYLLNPLVIDARGEWEAWRLSKHGVHRERTFFDLMKYEHTRTVRNMSGALTFLRKMHGT